MPIPLDDLMVLNRAATVARLLSGVAHDVNNSLLVISGTAELLEDGSGSPEARTKGMTRIRTQSAKAAAAIAEVLAFTRADTTLRTRVSLRETATSAVALRSYAISRAGLKIECSAPQDRTLMVVGNSPLLLQAVLNLIGNAEEALAGTRGQITVSLHAAGDRVLLRVADTGPGVPPADRLRIFEPFVKGDGRPQSVGLGLPVARAVAERHGGSLVLEPAEAGASFVMDLPLAP